MLFYGWFFIFWWIFQITLTLKLCILPNIYIFFSIVSAFPYKNVLSREIQVLLITWSSEFWEFLEGNNLALDSWKLLNLAELWQYLSSLNVCPRLNGQSIISELPKRKNRTAMPWSYNSHGKKIVMIRRWIIHHGDYIACHGPHEWRRFMVWSWHD